MKKNKRAYVRWDKKTCWEVVLQNDDESLEHDSYWLSKVEAMGRAIYINDRSQWLYDILEEHLMLPTE